MSESKLTQYEEIFEIIRTWPPATRFTLVHDVLDTLDPDVRERKGRMNTLDQALGLLVTDGPVPSDAQIQQWLDERRIEKYG